MGPPAEPDIIRLLRRRERTPVNSLKGVSARRLRQEHEAHLRRYLCGTHLWSPSYFAGSCGGAPLAVVKE